MSSAAAGSKRSREEGGDHICVIGAGGTILMDKENKFPATGAELDHLLRGWDQSESKDELLPFQCTLLNPTIDSANATPDTWSELCQQVIDVYDKETRGVVVLHGTDTMAYSAPAVAFLLRNFPCPVIFTGAQRKRDDESTDGPANFRGALTICRALIELGKRQSFRFTGLVFDGKLYFGSRIAKLSSTRVDAFWSPNAEEIVDNIPDAKFNPALRKLVHDAVANYSSYRNYQQQKRRSLDPTLLTVHVGNYPKVSIVHCSPGIVQFPGGVSGVVLVCYGSGNVSREVQNSMLRFVTKKKLGVIALVSECPNGGVKSTYDTSAISPPESCSDEDKTKWKERVWEGKDMTTAAAFVKLHIVLYQHLTWRGNCPLATAKNWYETKKYHSEFT